MGWLKATGKAAGMVLTKLSQEVGGAESGRGTMVGLICWGGMEHADSAYGECIGLVRHALPRIRWSRKGTVDG